MFYRNSIFVAETHVNTKVSSAAQQHSFGFRNSE